MRTLKSDELSPPTIDMEINDETIDAMKCLNMLGECNIKLILQLLIFEAMIYLRFRSEQTINVRTMHSAGILWAGRGQVRKSLLYLLSVKKLYHSASEKESLSKGMRKAELDSIYTHNLFYLAQAYGEYHNLRLSSIMLHISYDICHKIIDGSLINGDVLLINMHICILFENVTLFFS